MKNPWMSLWLSAANTWAGAARGFWTAEMQRQQQAVLKEITGVSSHSTSGKRARASRKRSPGSKRKAGSVR